MNGLKTAAALLLMLTLAPAYGADPPSRTSRWLLDVPEPLPVEPPTKNEIQQSIRLGIDFLLERQNPNGSWGSATNTKGLNIYAPVPGAHHAFRAAVTGLCVSAMIEAQDERPAVADAIDGAQRWLEEWLPRVRRGTDRHLQCLGPRLFDPRFGRPAPLPSRRLAAARADRRPDATTGRDARSIRGH